MKEWLPFEPQKEDVLPSRVLARRGGFSVKAPNSMTQQCKVEERIKQTLLNRTDHMYPFNRMLLRSICEKLYAVTENLHGLPREKGLAWLLALSKWCMEADDSARDSTVSIEDILFRACEAQEFRGTRRAGWAQEAAASSESAGCGRTSVESLPCKEEPEDCSKGNPSAFQSKRN